MTPPSLSLDRAFIHSRRLTKAAILIALGTAVSSGALHAAVLPDGVIQYVGSYEIADPALAGAANAGGGAIVPAGNAVNNLGTFDIVINPGPTLAGNAAALAAFNRAALKWEALFSDPITITIDADLANLGNPNIIGSTSSVTLMASYTTIRNALVADSALDADDSINASLPTSGQFAAQVPAGFSLTGNVVGTKANLKAMGFGGLDGTFGATDATITFNSIFNFSYTGLPVGGLVDFETVAVHEIGHALGFISVVDVVDNVAPQAVSPEVLDLFRFRDGTANDPATAADFTTFARDLSPNTNAITDYVLATLGGEPLENRMSTGVTTGDGRQASHWKDDALTGTLIGVMDPSLAAGVVELISASDARAFDLIGYDRVAVPEPGSIALILGGLLILGFRRGRRS